VLIRKAKTDDIDSFVKIYQKAYRGLEEYAYKTRKEIRRYFKWLRRRDPEGIFVATVSEPVGFVACDTNWLSSFEGKEEGEKVGEIHELFVSPEWQKKGIATVLLFKALEYAREKGQEMAELWVGEKNYRARRFYKENGFKEEGKWGHWIRMVKKL